MRDDFLILRAQIVRAIRAFFDEQGFVEMHTPRLIGLPGQEPYLEPMWTEVHEQNGRVHRGALITSPEYAMKKLLAVGFEKIYDLGPCFRDGEPWDGTHDLEFLMLEWYRREAGLEELMKDTEGMIQHVIKTYHNSVTTSADSGPIGLNRSDGSRIGAARCSLSGMTESGTFRRLTVREAMLQYAHVNLDLLLTDRVMMADVVRQHGHAVSDTDTWDDLFFKIFLSEVEPKLSWSDDGKQWQPTFLYNYPASMAALARKDSRDPRYALRTELYIGDLELANGFAELCDPVEQRARFVEEQSLRKSLGKEIWPIDESFLAALPKMGQAAGIAFGVDRLVMLLAGTTSISAVMPIPVRERFDQVRSYS